MGLIRINNRKNFILGEVPNLHPDSRAYVSYWKGEKKKIIEGFWGIDDKDINVDSVEKFNVNNYKQCTKWRFMPPALYFYINFGTILHRPKELPKTSPKLKIRPSLRDLDWEIYYDVLEARGFSGFANDEEYTCCVDIINPDIELENYDNTCFNKKGKLKEYIPAFKYLRQLHSKQLGLPIYRNGAQNYMILATRELGKSYSVAGVIVHELLMDGLKTYELGQKIPVSKQFVGSGISGKSHDLMKKIKLMVENLPGTWKPGTEDTKPSPLFKQMKGTIKPNNKWIHEYLKRSGAGWETTGSLSEITHGVWTTENPEAAAGERYTFVVCEEVGLCFEPNTKIRMADMSLKEIKNISIGEYVMGHNGTPQKVISTKAGKEQLYKVSQKFGEDYTVTKNHILYLNKKYMNYGNNNITPFKCFVQDFNSDNYSNRFLNETYGLTNDCLQFNNNVKLKLDPYYLGAWLGDGTKNSTEITIHDDNNELINYLYIYAKKLNMRISTKYNSKSCYKYSLCRKKGTKKYNKLKTHLNFYDILNNKNIPLDYQFASEQERLELLAGLIDTDGCLVKRKTREIFEFYQTNREELVENVRLLAKNLGFRVRIQKKISNLGYNGKILNEYRNRYTLRITGDIWRIPTKIERKQAKYKPLIKHINSTPISIEKLNKGEYNGITLEGSPLYLLKDGTIVHNTPNIFIIHGSNSAAQMQGTVQMGTSIYIGTGGNVEKILESEMLFTDPSTYNMLEFEDEYEGSGKIGRFFSVIYKDEEFKDENGNTNEGKATEFYLKRRKRLGESNNKRALDIEMLNYPMKPSEMFLNKNSNKFPIADIKIRIRDLMSGNNEELKRTYIGFYGINQDGTVKFEEDKSARPIHEFPLNKDNIDLAGAVEMFEPPVKNANGDVPSGIYASSLDPVDDDGNEKASQSLQSFYIINLLTDRIVLEYTARTKFAKHYYEQVRRILLDYNTTVLYENQKKGFYTYFDQKNCLFLLEDTPQALKDAEVQRGSFMGNKSKGIYATDKINYWGQQELLPNYLESQAYEAESGVTNLHILKSLGALKEMVYYNGKINTDRISSLGLLMIIRELKMKHKINIKKKRKRIINDPFFNRHAINHNHPSMSFKS